MKKLDSEIIAKWHNTISQNMDAFLDFAEGLNINKATSENGEKTLYFEDGVHYIAHGYRMGENDGEKEKAIIQALEACGFDF